MFFSKNLKSCPSFFKMNFLKKELMEFFKSTLKLEPCTSQKNHPTWVFFSLSLTFILHQQPYQLATSLFTFSTLKVLSLLCFFCFYKATQELFASSTFVMVFFLMCRLLYCLFFPSVVFLFCVFLMPQWICLHKICASLIRSTCFSFNLLVMCVFSLSFVFVLCVNNPINWEDQVRRHLC